MAFNTSLNTEKPQSVGTAAATLTAFDIHYPAVDITVETADVRIAFGVGPLTLAATGEAAPTTDYAKLLADSMCTKYNPNRDGRLPWKLLIWDTTATATVTLQGVIPKAL